MSSERNELQRGEESRIFPSDHATLRFSYALSFRPSRKHEGWATIISPHLSSALPFFPCVSSSPEGVCFFDFETGYLGYPRRRRGEKEGRSKRRQNRNASGWTLQVGRRTHGWWRRGDDEEEEEEEDEKEEEKEEPTKRRVEITDDWKKSKKKETVHAPAKNKTVRVIHETWTSLSSFFPI